MPIHFHSTVLRRRRVLANAVAPAALALAAACAPALAATHVDLRGASVGYFPAESLLAATGHASLSDGSRSIQADSVRYDLYREKLLATGHVHVTYHGSTIDCAAYALDRRSGETHYITLDAEPDAFAVQPSAPPKAEPPPPGTFDAADIDGLRPYIEGHHAIVIPQTSVRFTPAAFPTAFGKSPDLPTFLYTFASNPNLYQTSLPTATIDQPFGIAGSENSLTQFRVRYSTNYGAGAGLEQHFINGNRSYVSIAGIEGRSPSADFLGYTQIGRRATANLSAQSFQGTNAIQSRFTYSIPNLNSELDVSQVNHLSAQSISASTPDRTIPHLIAYKFTAGYGHAFTPGSSPFESTWFSTVGGSLYTLNGLRGPLHTELSGRFDYALVSFDYPHNTLATNVVFSVARQIRRNVRFYGSATFSQFENRYRYNSAQYLSLPTASNPYRTPDGTLYPGYFAYAGLSTARTYYGVVSFNPNALFNVNFGLTHAHDFPDQYHGYGRPPLQATLDMRVRFSSTFALSYYRQYNFGWAGQYFAPGASLVVTP